jgi:phage terminase large subunit
MKEQSTLSQSKARCSYQPFGSAIAAWKSRRREVVMAGPAGTGKSRALLEKLHFCADKYPGMRAIIVRKTRESLTQTAMVTYENKVLPQGWLGNLIHFRTSEQEYRYPNGSIIAIGGMDKSTKIMSAEYDMAYVQEGTELFEDDWEALTTRLRNGVMPYQQLIADCNPGPPTHWLKRRCDRGATLMLESRHEDNPSVTPEYLATLDALTGVRYLRLRLGKWAAAEGMVYDDWDRSIHLVSKQKLIQWGVFQDESEKLNRNVIKRVLAGVDWGYTNPGVIQVYGVDGDERLYLLREVYQTGKVIDWWVEQAKQLQQEYDIEQFICDPAEPSYISQFNGNGLTSIGAVNDIAPGISELQSRLKLAGDGRPRFYVYEYSLKERDEKREAVHETYCFEQEVDAYAWPVSKNGQSIKEVPVKVNDHSCDVARYIAMRLNRSVYRLPMSDDDYSTSMNTVPAISKDQPFPITQPIMNDSVPVQVVSPVAKPVDAFSWADRKWGENW